MRVGVEVGGTFTDLVCVEEGQTRVAKVPSTPAAPERGALHALAVAAIDLGAVEDLSHGSTVATNAVLERNGARVAFVATRGFRDVLHLQRNDRRRIFDLLYQKAQPLVRRRDCFEVNERVLANGEVLRPLDVDDARQRLVPALAAAGYQAVAVCLLNGYANGINEYRLRDVLEEALPDIRVTCSHQVSREYREYERASTTALAAYVQPVLSGYLERFETALTERGFLGTLGIMQSNGGRASITSMVENAATALYSGPAAGVVGALRQAGRSGFDRLITFDMGGTSTDVCLVKDGQPLLDVGTEIDGLPVRTPVIDIVTVGAGGGSVVWCDEGGMLRVGPKSSGATPGPACYGQGGELPTITDAHVVRGSLLTDEQLAGELTLDVESARRSFEPLAGTMGLTVERLADSAIRLAVSNIVQAIHVVSTERGHDPRDYVLVPYGGAGPMHAVRVAEALAIDTVLVPPQAGVLSAFGLVASDWLHYRTLTRRILLDDCAATRLTQTVRELSREAGEQLRRYGLEETPRFTVAAFMRFVGQAFELEVSLEGSLDAWSPGAIRRQFDDVYERTFMHRPAPERAVEIVSVRVGAMLPRVLDRGLQLEPSPPSRTPTVPVFEKNEWFECANLSRADLRGVVEGPAVVREPTSTLYVPVGWCGHHDGHHNLIIRRGGHP